MTDDVAPGSIAVHGNAKIRGTMGGATGTFAGSFTADTINAVDYINIRDGSVSNYYLFSPGRNGHGDLDATFTIPAQRLESLYRISMEITAMNYDIENAGYHWVYSVGLVILKNGSKMMQSGPPITKTPMNVPLTISFVDTVSANQSTTYRAYTVYNDGYAPYYVNLEPLGDIMVEHRKR